MRTKRQVPESKRSSQRRRSWRGAFTAIALISIALSANSVHAANGVIEINQSIATAGDVTGTGADAPGFPITLDQGGAYRLTSNLSVPANEIGIVVTATHASLDLGGFTIEGGGTSGTLIQSNQPHVTVHDGSLMRSGNDGIALGNNAYVLRIHSAEHVGSGIVLGSHATVSESRTTANGGNGIAASINARIERSSAFNNQGVGFDMQAGSVFVHATISGNLGGTLIGGNDLGHSLCDGSTLCREGCRAERCDGTDSDCDGEIDEQDAIGCTVYFEDKDGDGFGTPPNTCLCAAAAPFSAANTNDCYDGNAQARPGQTSYFDTDRGDGSFDYDCDGSAEQQRTTLGNCGISPNCSFNDQAGWNTASVPACGESEPFLNFCRTGSFFVCTRITEEVTQACR